MALLDSKQLNPRLTGSFTLSGSFAGDSASSGSFARLQISGNSSLVGRVIAGENIELSNAQQVQWGGLNNAIFGHSSQNYVHIKTGGTDRIKINSSGLEVISGNISGSATSTGSFGEINSAGRIFEQGTSVIDHATAMAIVFGG
mgnify:CR=1 FL=1